MKIELDHLEKLTVTFKDVPGEITYSPGEITIETSKLRSIWINVDMLDGVGWLLTEENKVRPK